MFYSFILINVGTWNETEFVRLLQQVPTCLKEFGEGVYHPKWKWTQRRCDISQHRALDYPGLKVLLELDGQIDHSDEVIDIQLMQATIFYVVTEEYRDQI